ncbi:MAG: cell division protein FtsX [Bacteroidota bacterium]
MSFRYTVKESFSGFQRAKLSSFISILTITISLLLLGVFVILTVNASRFIDALRSKVELEVFLQEPLSRREIADLQQQISSTKGVDTLIFISKDDAARIFKQEFGEDIDKVLDFNPLPPSFKLSLKDGYKTSARVEELHQQLLKIKGVDSVVYRKALLELIDERTASVNNLALGLGMLISISAIFLVSNTIRLAIYAKRRLIRTMELVGATRGFIRLPFLLEGIMQGLLGGILASSILYLLLEYAAPFVSLDFATYIRMEPVFYLAVIIAGIILGLLGSVISILRFIRLASTDR